MAKRFLSIGASGFIGARLCAVLGWTHALATYHRIATQLARAHHTRRRDSIV